MIIRPKVGEDKIDQFRGTGKLGSSLEYLKTSDPISYYYEKFKSSGNKYLRDDMWTESAKKGESAILADILLKLETLQDAEDFDSTYLDKYQQYENKGLGDYDAYMLALSIPTLDNETKTERIDPETGYSFGKYTDREWTQRVLDSTFQRYDAEIVEQKKKEKNWWERMWTEIGTYTSTSIMNIVGGTAEFLGDIYNLGEGLLNMAFNWSDDANAGDRFLYAFSNDQEDPGLLQQTADYMDEMSYLMQYKYSEGVNAVEAYEAGYIPNSWHDMVWTSNWRTEGAKVYDNKFAEYWNGATQAIGYMLPSIIFAMATGGSGSFLMYTGMASGTMRDTVERAAENGLSYKDLDAGQVVSNAVIKAGVQWAIEIALSKAIGFFTTSERLRGMGKNKPVGAPSIGTNKFTSTLFATGRLAKSMLKEGFEESLQDLSDGIIDSMYGLGNGEINKVFAERGEETIHYKNLIQSFIIGAMTEGIVTTTTGFVKNTQFLSGKNRFLMEGKAGKVTKMGYFQSIAFNDTLKLMNGWNNTLRDPKASSEAKREAAINMQEVMQPITSLMTTFSQSDMIKANAILLEQSEGEQKAQAIAKLTDAEYVTKLYDSFIEARKELPKKYVPSEPIKQKIKRGITNLIDKFKKQKVTKLENIITKEVISDNTTIGDDAFGKLIDALDKLGVKALVGVDGAIIAKSEDVAFVNNKILVSGDIAEIVKGIAYQQVRDAVKTKLSTTQKNRILKTYRQIVGVDGTLEDAITALLFDKNFYTKVLLLTEEKSRGNKEDELKMLSTIDNLIKSKASASVANGTLTEGAYKVLLNKVYETMRVGLINYCTNYARLNLGEISNDVLSPELKEVISNHRNVIFSEQLDKGLKGEVLTDRDLTLFDDYVDKFTGKFTAEVKAAIKQKARSTNVNDRVDAFTIMTIASKIDNYQRGGDKIVYIPTSSEGIVEKEYIEKLQDFFGSDYKSIVLGNYDPTLITDEARNFITPGYKEGNTVNRYDLSNKKDRLACMREAIYLISHGTLTVGADGTILKIIDKEGFLKPEYLGAEGDTKFKTDLQKGTIKTVGDIVNKDVKAPDKIRNIKFEIKVISNLNGRYNFDTNSIEASINFNTNSLMHEITHATQFITGVGENIDAQLGDRVETFRLLPNNVLDSLDKYISNNFSLTYNFLKANKTTKFDTPDIVYFMLAGEIQARSTLTTHMFDVGFTYRNNRTELVSPDDKETWSLAPSNIKVQFVAREQSKQRVKEIVSSGIYDEALKSKQSSKKAKTVPSDQISMFSDDMFGSVESSNKTIVDDFNGLTDNSKVNIINVADDVPLNDNETKYGLELAKNLKIRRLTPKESFALMGVKANDFERIAKNQTDRSLYHLAGDSIVVNPLMRIFDKLYNDNIITKPLRLIEFFAGYGSQNFALKYTNRDYQSWKIAEWAIKSIQAYKDAHHYNDNKNYAKGMSKTDIVNYLVDIGVSMNYNEPAGRVSLNAKSLNELQTIYNNIQATNNLVNIQKVTGDSLEINDTDNYDYLLTYSFPCQDLSRAGRRAGMSSGEATEDLQISMFDKIEDINKTEIQTRSGMLWEVDRILRELYESGKPMPKVLLMENVPEVHNEQNITDFNKWLSNLSKYGYTNSYADLKASDYGAPQKRVRTFMVSILNGPTFSFPPKEKLTSTVQDLLESNVDNKYYLSNNDAKRFMGHNVNFTNNTTSNPINEKIASTLTTTQSKRAQGGNFQSELIKGEADLYSVLHPSDKDSEYTKNLISKIKRNEILSQSDISRQESLFAEDQSIDEPEVTKLKDSKEEQRERYRQRKRDSFVSQKKAAQSNLKYGYNKTSRPLFKDKRIQEFVIHTTPAFDKLDTAVQKMIKPNLDINLHTIGNYVATTANMSDYTFKMIAKYVYNNEELAKLNFKEFIDLRDNSKELSILSYYSDNRYKVQSPSDMYKEEALYREKAKHDTALQKQITSAHTLSNLIKLENKKYVDIKDVDPLILNKAYFKHYKGNLSSIFEIYSLGKYLTFKVELEEARLAGTGVGSWTERYKKAETDYREAVKEFDKSEVDELLDNNLKLVEQMAPVDKENMIEDFEIAKLVKQEASVEEIKAKQRELDIKFSRMTEAELNTMYIQTMYGIKEVYNQVKQDTKSNNTDEDVFEMGQKGPTRKSVKDGIRKFASSLRELIKTEIETNGKNTYYNLVPENLKSVIKPDNDYKLPYTYYTNMSDTELNTLKNELQSVVNKIRRKIKDIKAEEKQRETIMEKVDKQQKQIERYKEQVKRQKEEIEYQKRLKTKAKEDKKTLREKLVAGQRRWQTTIDGQEFSFNSTSKPNDVVNNILNTTWSKTAKSRVQGVSNNEEQIIANGKEFFYQNGGILSYAELSQIEEAAKWFLGAKVDNMTLEDARIFEALNLYFIGYVLSQTRPGNIYANMNENLKREIENHYQKILSTSGTLLAIGNNLMPLIDPIGVMSAADIELDGVPIVGDLKTRLFDAVKSGSLERMRAIINEIHEYVIEKRGTKRSIVRQAVTVRSMAMLAGPLTWLRNIVSNIVLKPLNKFFTWIGSKVMTDEKYTQSGQLKLDKPITKDIQDFITKNFVDNGFFDLFISNLSKYNPSDISERKFKGGKASKEAIMIQLVLKSMYGQYYNENIFNTKKPVGRVLNKMYHFLMKAMSDEKFVREAAIRYFGKIIAEKGYSMKDAIVTDEIMNDLSTAIGLAMYDYMHSDNLLSKFEAELYKKSPSLYFAYKQILPFASSGWNWFKSTMKMTPFGLYNAIKKLKHLEANIAKAQKAWEEGRSQISPELTEYIIRRDIGAGVFGTTCMIFGIILAAMGIISLEDEDYGIPKIRIGNVSFDISTIYGSSSVLAGAALMNGFKGEDGSLLKALNNYTDFMLNDFFVMEIVKLDMYSDGTFSMGMDQLESIVLSYIPNLLSYIAGGTYKGTTKKDKFWKRALSKIPFIANAVDKNIDPYTGSEGSWIEAINRLVPYFSYDVASKNERKTEALGLNKEQLNGKYKINGKEFNVKGKDLEAINKAYGQWNAEDLTKFYNNQMRVKVKVDDNHYRTLSYNQMNREQRKNAVQTIMKNNAEMAKIMAWTQAGNKYFGSADTYVKLRKRGITKGVYKGTKGFVQSK